MKDKMTRGTVLALALEGALAGVPQVALAQSATEPTSRLSTGITEKPLALGMRMDVTHDSNVVQGSDEAARLRKLKKGELVTIPSATVDYGYNDSRLGVAVNGVLGYDFHEKNTILDRERIEAAAKATVLIGDACSVTAKINYWRKQTRQQDLTTIVTANRVAIRVATLGETCVTAGGLTQSLEILQSGWHNSSLLNINNDRYAISGMVGYTQPGFGTVGVTLLYEETDFFGRPAILVMTPDTLEKTQVGVQYSSPVDRRLSGTISAGYVHSRAKVGPESRLAGKRIREGLVAQAAILWKPTDRLRINALAARRIRHDTSFTITTDLQLSVDYELAPKWHFGAGGRWLRDAYYGRDVTLPQIAQDRQDQTLLYGTLTHRLTPRTAIAADVRYDQGEANFSPFDYKGTRLTLTLTTALENPFR